MDKKHTHTHTHTHTRELWDEVDSSLLHNLMALNTNRLRRIRKAEGGSIKAVA
jgi:hypothetical protein